MLRFGYVRLASTEATWMTQRLFFYGALAPGRENEHVLGDVPGTWELATVRAGCYSKAGVLRPASPASSWTKTDQRSTACCLSSAMLSEYWKRLGHFEGDGYERVLTSARLQSGGTAMAYIYILRGMSAASDTSPSA
jgi:gamma-glutamylcyclotransferase (GGCT)/AIG2-like uncharacterized protein YtfP